MTWEELNAAKKKKKKKSLGPIFCFTQTQRIFERALWQILQYIIYYIYNLYYITFYGNI